MKPTLKLFTPGPVMTSNAVKQSMGHADMPHRRPSFEAILERNRQNILRLFRANSEYTAVVVSGSGTAANETALSSLIRPGEEVLLINGGTFGERLEEILVCYGYPLTQVRSDAGIPPDLKAIEDAIRENPKLGWVCVVFHETSTGMINPVRQIGDIVHRLGRKLYVDCVSAIGGEDIDVVRDQIDACSGSANKAIAGPTGISFVVARRSVIPPLSEVPRRNIYLNLQKLVEWAEGHNQTPNTPAVTNFIGLDIALQELFDEGAQNRIQRYHECSRLVRSELEALQLQILVPEEIGSNTVTSAFLPAGINLEGFIDEMERRGCVLYPGKGKLAERGMFQIANMGWIYPEDIHMLFDNLKSVLKK